MNHPPPSSPAAPAASVAPATVTTHRRYGCGAVRTASKRTRASSMSMGSRLSATTRARSRSSRV